MTTMAHANTTGLANAKKETNVSRKHSSVDPQNELPSIREVNKEEEKQKRPATKSTTQTTMTNAWKGPPNATLITTPSWAFPNFLEVAPALRPTKAVPIVEFP